MNEARKEGNQHATRIPRPEAADARPPRHGHGGGPAPVGAGRHGRHEHRPAVQWLDPVRAHSYDDDVPAALQLTNFTLETVVPTYRDRRGIEHGYWRRMPSQTSHPAHRQGREPRLKPPPTGYELFPWGSMQTTSGLAADFEEPVAHGLDLRPEPPDRRYDRRSHRTPGNTLPRPMTALRWQRLPQWQLERRHRSSRCSRHRTSPRSITTFGTTFDTVGPPAPQRVLRRASWTRSAFGTWLAPERRFTATMNAEFGFPPAGFIGRWGMNEGTRDGLDSRLGGAQHLGTMVATSDLGCWCSRSLTLRLLVRTPPCLQWAQPIRHHGQHVSAGRHASSRLEVWINPTGRGATTSTGAGGQGTWAGSLPRSIPLISKGRAERRWPQPST